MRVIKYYLIYYCPHQSCAFPHSEGLLTHLGRVTHICTSKLNIIGSDNGLSPDRRQCWNIVNWTPRNKFQWNFNWYSYIFIQENAFENVVWKMATILSRPQCVNPDHIQHHQTHLSHVLFQVTNASGHIISEMYFHDHVLLVKFRCTKSLIEIFTHDSYPMSSANAKHPPAFMFKKSLGCVTAHFSSERCIVWYGTGTLWD